MAWSRLVSALFVAVGVLISSPAWATEVQVFKDHGDWRKPPTATFDAVMELVIEEVGDAPNLAEEGSGRVVIDIYKQGRNTSMELIIVDVTDLGGGDDSVGASKRRFGLKKQQNQRFKLTHYGYLQQCLRGADKNKWVTGSCP